MSKVKSVSEFNGTSWGTAVPLGADADNVDITSTTTDPSDSSNTLVSLDSSDVKVLSSNSDTGASAWTKFNLFRKRVINNFNRYIEKTNVINSNGNYWNIGSPTASSQQLYSAFNLNRYILSVIGYSGAPSAGTIADQLSNRIIYFTATVYAPEANSSSIYATTIIPITGCTSNHKLMIFDTNEPEYLVGNTYYWTTDTNSLQVQVAVSTDASFYGVLIRA